MSPFQGETKGKKGELELLVTTWNRHWTWFDGGWFEVFLENQDKVFYSSTHIFSVLVIIISNCLTLIEDEMHPLRNNWNRVGWFCTAHGKAKVFPLGLVSCQSKQREAITHCLPAYAPLFAFHTLYWTDYKKYKKTTKKGTIKRREAYAPLFAFDTLYWTECKKSTRK